MLGCNEALANLDWPLLPPLWSKSRVPFGLFWISFLLKCFYKTKKNIQGQRDPTDLQLFLLDQKKAGSEDERGEVTVGGPSSRKRG